jgi:hypothetical protein
MWQFSTLADRFTVQSVPDCPSSGVAVGCRTDTFLRPHHLLAGMTDLLDRIRWPLVAKAAAAGIGLGMIYGVATSRFVFGMLLGFAAGVGFAVGRSFTT